MPQLFTICLLTVVLFLPNLFMANLGARAQEIVHAVSGTLKSIDEAANTITIKTDDGTGGFFRVLPNSHVSLDFDDKVRKDSTPADSFTKTGARVLVYYYGGAWEVQRTAVALRDLGSGPFEQDTGSVVGFDKHRRLLKIKGQSGNDKSFHIADKAVAETPLGAVDADDYHPDKGDQVRVIAEGTDGDMTALYIRAK
jgi:hypothetical protein